METDEEGRILTTYTRGHRLISMRREDATYFYHYDGLGSVRQLTGEPAIICFIATAAFGTPLAAYISQREWAQALVRSSLQPLLWFEGRRCRGRGRRRKRRIRREVEIEAKYTYCAFGTLISQGNNNNPYGFTGERQFREAAGLVFLRARYYDPSIGRFISRDPILLPMVGTHGSFWLLPYLVMAPQMLYPYVYAHNNPVNFIDPGGKLVIEITLGTVITAIGVGYAGYQVWLQVRDFLRWARAHSRFRECMDNFREKQKKCPSKDINNYIDEVRQRGPGHPCYREFMDVVKHSIGVPGTFPGGPIVSPSPR